MPDVPGNRTVVSWPSPRDRWLDRERNDLTSYKSRVPPETIGTLVISRDIVVEGQPSDPGRWAFFVGANPRTGSRLLAMLLSRHKAICCTHEHFPLPKIVLAMTAEVVGVFDLIGSIAEGVSMRAETVSSMLGAWRNGEASKPILGDIGSYYLETTPHGRAGIWGRLIDICLPDSTRLLSVRCVLDAASSWTSQPWYYHGKDTSPAIFYVANSYVTNTLSARRGHIPIDRDELMDRDRFEDTLRSAFGNIGADPDDYDYDAAFRSLRPDEFRSSIGRWRGDDLIKMAVDEIAEREPSLGRAIEAHPYLLITDEADEIIHSHEAGRYGVVPPSPAQDGAPLHQRPDAE